MISVPQEQPTKSNKALEAQDEASVRAAQQLLLVLMQQQQQQQQEQQNFVDDTDELNAAIEASLREISEDGK